jgi:hypothetical protein
LSARAVAPEAATTAVATQTCMKRMAAICHSV